MRGHRLKIAGEEKTRLAEPGYPDPITAWLDTLSMVMKLPRDEREGVRDELAGHLRERVRDLMLTGVNETQAAQTALSELGDAVNLAQRLRAASRTPARRMAMHLTVFGVAGAALITSVIALRGGAPSGEAQPATGGAQVPTSTMPVTITSAPDDIQKVRLTQEADATWGAFFKQISDKTKLPVDVRWRLFEGQGWNPGESTHIALRDTPLLLAIMFINEEIPGDGLPLDFRVLDGRLLFATQEYFDQQETVLVSYDLSKQVADRVRDTAIPPGGVVNGPAPSPAEAVTTEVHTLLQHMVHPEGWQDNGGSLATMAVFGSKLFIKAPKRYHTEIQWVIDQLPKSTAHADANGIPELFEASIARRPQIEAEFSVPVLRDVPLINNDFKSRSAVDIGQGPVTVTAENGGHVQVTGPDGTLKADKIHINPGDPTAPSSASPAPVPPHR